MIHDEDQAMSKAKVTALSTNIPVQLGMSLQVTTNGTLAIAAKDLVRWKGKSPSDIQAVRVYLGPLQPQPGLDGSNVLPPSGFVEYQPPTPWQTPQPTQYDAMVTGFYARISFGGGGVQHVAYVDWQPRGSVIQVSANYVQVDAQGTVAVPFSQDLRLPRMLAHIAPEPGGGDSVQPATYTYPPRDFNNNPNNGVLFQVPPFARAFRPLINQISGAVGDEIYQVIVTSTPAGAIRQVYMLDPLDSNSFNRDDLPLDGNATDVEIFALRRSVYPGVLDPIMVRNVGCMFLLDL